MTLPPFKTQCTFAKVIFKINRNHLENLCLCVYYLSIVYQQNIASTYFALRNQMILFKIREFHKLRLLSFIELKVIYGIMAVDETKELKCDVITAVFS